MNKNKRGPLTPPKNISNDIISTGNENVNGYFENKKIKVQIAGNNIFQRIPVNPTPASLMLISDLDNVRAERYYSTITYVVPSQEEFGKIPIQDGQAELSEKTSEYCVKRFPMLPSLVCDFDCVKGDDGRPDERDLNMLTKHIIELAGALDAAEIKINKDAVVYFSGMKGYRLVIPYSVIGVNEYEPANFIQMRGDMERMAIALIEKFSHNPDFLIARLDRGSFAKDRIMRAAYSLHPMTRTVAFPLDSLDIDSEIGIAEVRIKAKNLYDGKVERIDFGVVIPEINPAVNKFYLEALWQGAPPNRHAIRPTSPVTTSDTNTKAKRPKHLVERTTEDCACLEYYTAHCDKLLAGDKSNRFEANFPFVLLAQELGGERGVIEFHKAIAQRIRPGQDVAQTAEEWTVEIISSLEGRHPSCKSYETPSGETIVGTHNRLNHLINVCGQKLPKFECNPNCPFRPRDVCINPSSEVLNQWATDYVRLNTVISWQQSLYRYEDGCYMLLPDEPIEKDISDYLGIHFTPTRLKQIKEKIRTSSIVKDLKVPEGMICVNNGILDLGTFTIQPHTPALIFFGKIRVNYDPALPPPESGLLDTFLSNLFPEPQHKDDLDLLMKFAGYCFTQDTGYGVAVIMISDGNSGKSSFALFLLGVLGDENYVVMDLNDISNPQHAEKLKNKRLCYVDEIGMSELINDGCIKSRITGGIVSYNTKFKPTGEFKCAAKFLFGTNTPVIQTNDFSEGFQRRFIMVKFPVDFDKPAYKDKKIVDVEKRLLGDQNAKDRFFYLAMERLKELRRDKCFRLPDSKRSEIRNMLQANNIYRDFASNYMFYSPGNRLLKADVYRTAQAYAKDIGKGIGSTKKFWPEMKRVIKCSIDPDAPGTKYLKTGGHEYLKDIAIKGITLSLDKKQVEYVTLEKYSNNNKELQITANDVSVVEMPYDEYVGHVDNITKSTVVAQEPPTCEEPEPEID